jgi:hypothetical protein
MARISVEQGRAELADMGLDSLKASRSRRSSTGRTKTSPASVEPRRSISCARPSAAQRRSLSRSRCRRASPSRRSRPRPHGQRV